MKWLKTALKHLKKLLIKPKPRSHKAHAAAAQPDQTAIPQAKETPHV